MTATTVTHEEDILPLQTFDPSVRASMEKYPRGDEEGGGEDWQSRGHGRGLGRRDGSRSGQYPRYDNGRERREALHIAGDLSTNRPGHFKRLDSEARIGGGHGVEEVEDRI